MIALKMVAAPFIANLTPWDRLPHGPSMVPYGWKTVLWLLEETHVLKVVGSTSSIVYWMDIFHINLL